MAAQAIQKLLTILPCSSNSCGGLASWPGIPLRTEKVRVWIYYEENPSIESNRSYNLSIQFGLLLTDPV